MNAKLTILISLVFSVVYNPVIKDSSEKKETICTHDVVRDENGKILSWYQPDNDGEAFGHVIKLASEFIKDSIPAEPKTGLKLYYLFCEFEGPEYNPDYYKGITGRTTLPHNPACVFAGFTDGLAVKYRAFSGDDAYLKIVRDCLDHMLKHGTTPGDWKWGACPYASSSPGEPEYAGSGMWEPGRGDGDFVLEPDKVGEMGYAYLQFYEITEEKIYLDAAISCADALAKNRVEARYSQSPWPFRVHAQTGEVVEKYCSNVLPAIKLFDELNRIKDRINLDSGQVEKYKETREEAWQWLFSTEGPMKTSVWKGYFEDVHLDTLNENRVQVTPLEVARYIIQHPEYDPFYKQNVPGLIKWCNSVFGTDGSKGYNAQCEQLWCYQPMGSHTSRYASVCAMWYNLTKNDWFKNEAFENFNWATYCTSNRGFVSVGTSWKGAWFSDGYGDYIKHFIDGIAAVPEWAPDNENHLLSSTSVVQDIKYENTTIVYRTYLPSTEILKLTRIPERILVDGKVIPKSEVQVKNTWNWEKLENGGVLRINHLEGRMVKIEL